MKKRMKWVLAMMMAFVLIVGVSGGAVASRGERNAMLHYSDIKLCVNGEYVQPRDANGAAVEPFTINGTTYLPVRAVGNALGLDVDWDGTTSTVYLGKKPSSVSGEVWTLRNYVDDFEPHGRAVYHQYKLDRGYVQQLRHHKLQADRPNCRG